MIYFSLETFSYFLRLDTRSYTELTFLQGTFRKNGYTEKFIDKCFKKFLNK